MCRKYIYLFFLFNILTAFSLAAHSALAMPKATQESDIPTASGTVIETMDASGYTYMLVETATGQNWVAIPETKVGTGSTVEYYQGMVMKDFASKTLDRTFPAITFSSGLAGPSGKSVQPQVAAADDSFSAAVKAERGAASTASEMTSSSGSTGAIVPLEEIAIEKSSAANGYSVEEIFSKAGELNGQKIQVRAKVVKFSPLIMGKNWIHLQDGTGNPMHNSHDLVATTDETIEVESVVVVEGILAADKDFGAGYTYSAIIENATVAK